MRHNTGKECIIGIILSFILIPASCEKISRPKPVTQKDRIMLWNGKDFSGWSLFTTEENIDSLDIWTVVDGVIHCTGEARGFIRTDNEYDNYYLHVEWRWPDKPTNSGVLLHTTGPDKIWPKAIECQLKAGSAGDFVLINGTGITVDGEKRRNLRKQFVVIPKKEKSSEKSAGQWNTYDIYCNDDSVRCYVNGRLQNEGTAPTDKCGAICLQSEGGPIEFRHVYLVPLELLEK